MHEKNQECVPAQDEMMLRILKLLKVNNPSNFVQIEVGVKMSPLGTQFYKFPLSSL